MPTRPISRRNLLRGLAAGLAAPATFRAFGGPPSETVLHASFGTAGMALADIRSLTASPHLKLVAVADVDLGRTAEVKKMFPEVRVYQDWRELLDKEKSLDSVNISTPDHMHAPITMRAMQRGLNVYTQKPLAHSIDEARRLARFAKEKGVVSQMGIQIHSHPTHRTVVATVRSGVIGKVKAVHTWSGKAQPWGDRSRRPDRSDPIPKGLDWDAWLGVAADRPFLDGYYHPREWRKRIDLGTGTLGDMGCHLLDPVFGSLGLTSPKTVQSVGGAANPDNWGLDSEIHFTFPGTPFTTDAPTLSWYDGSRRPPDPVKSLLGDRPLSDQGSIYIGTEGVLYSRYINTPILLPAEKFAGHKLPEPGRENHYLQFIEACRGNGKTSTPFDYSGPLTETALLGCLSTRFPSEKLEWDAPAMKVANVEGANRHIRKAYRKGWEVEGL